MEQETKMKQNFTGTMVGTLRDISEMSVQVKRCGKEVGVGGCQSQPVSETSALNELHSTISFG